MAVRFITRLLLILFVPVLFSCSDGDNLTLADKGKSPYIIVISSQADKQDQKAAEEFQKYFEQVSHVLLPIVTDSSPVSENEIILGKCNRLDGTVLPKEMANIGEDGFIIRTLEKKLVIAGGADKGTLYGVYTFLEDYIGCRKYSAAAALVSTRENIVLDPVNVTQNPAFNYRELHFPDPIRDEDYRNWHRLDVKEGKDEWGLFVHTFQTLVPPEKYFKDHPEYFSWLNVQRIPDGQLCLSNSDVLKIVIEGLRERMREKPEAKYWSVSQNDTYKACECEECKKLYDQYGGYSGAMIRFVNQVAAVFPDKIISTLAYQYTRSAPKNIKPVENVNIMFCSIECNRSRPIAEDTLSSSFRKDCEDWCALTNNIFMWDYVVQFRNMVSPFPNLRVLQRNIQYFRDKGIKMMFQQGTGGNISEFYELRQYLIAKLLWNPDADVDALMNDFLGGYYGPASVYIKDYIDRMHDALTASGGQLGIYGYPYDGIHTYLTPELIKTYSQLFNQAEQAVKEQPDFLERVKVARLPLEFAILDISLRNVNNDLTFFNKEGDRFIIRSEMLNLLDKFTIEAKAAGIKRYWEHGNEPDKYREMVLNYVNRSTQQNMALGKPVMLTTEFSEKYPVGGNKALTDGLKGVNDYHFNWLGFEGPDMIAIVDLGEPKDIRSIQTSFLQDIQSWVFMPVEVSYFGSNDNIKFTLIHSLHAKISGHQQGVVIEDFKADFEPIKDRYIKVVAKNIGTCPPWHPGYSSPAWIFCDEILLR